jgi:hypothetical protein
LCAALLFTACDGGTNNNNNGGQDLAMVVSTGDMELIRPEPDLAGNPDLAEPGGCGADNAACALGTNIKGLCKANVCGSCNDATDDANCVAAYGAGFACTGGVCQMGGCKNNAGCNGKICDQTTGKCRSCKQDADCPSATPNCDTATGQCQAAAVACTVNTACGLNNKGFCCGAGTPKCFSGSNCCTNSDCVNAGLGDTCTDHVCNTATNCTSPAPQARFFVDPDAPADHSGVGSKQCPFRNLDTALSKVPNPAPMTGFTVCTKGTFDSSNDDVWPRVVRQYVELDGHYCDEAANPMRSVLKVSAGNTGVSFREQGPATIHGYEISLDGTEKTNSGIYVHDTGMTEAVKIFDVEIYGFEKGIYVNKETEDTRKGNVVINKKTNVHNNHTGLRISGGSTAVINVTQDTDAQAQFESNANQGIYVGNGDLTIKGAVRTNAGDDNDNPRTVSANLNGQNGIWMDDANGKLSVDYFKARNNGFNGISSVNTATLTATNSVFTGNTRSGIRIQPGTSSSVATVNLGTSAAPGKNQISGNTETNLCVNFEMSDTLKAAGNAFGNGADCSQASPGRMLGAGIFGCNQPTDLYTWGTDGYNAAIIDNCQMCYYDLSGVSGACP